MNRTALAILVNFARYGVIERFPPCWRRDLRQVAADADFRDYPRTPVLSREAEGVTHIKRGRVRADMVQQRLPWLYELYRSDFVGLAAGARAEPVEASVDDRYGVVLNVQRGKDMRFECHVDSNPVTGLLFFTEHPAGGGELVIGHDPAAVGVEAVERCGTVIKPRAGELIYFDGKTHPHYARALRSGSEMRIVAVMNFYTESCPESTRPPRLNRHLFGED